MTVYVVVGVWSGCIEEVTAWLHKDEANIKAEQLRSLWGIIPGLEAESPHVVDVYDLEVQ